MLPVGPMRGSTVYDVQSSPTPNPRVNAMHNVSMLYEMSPGTWQHVGGGGRGEQVVNFRGVQVDAGQAAVAGGVEAKRALQHPLEPVAAGGLRRPARFESLAG